MPHNYQILPPLNFVIYRELLTTCEQASTITIRERLTVERRFSLTVEPQPRTFAAIAQDLGVSDSRVEAIFNKAMRRLRRQPAFVQTLNASLSLVPYPPQAKRPYWLTEQGLLESILTHVRRPS